MSTLYTLTGFSFVDNPAGAESPEASVLEIGGTDDLAFTFTANPEPEDASDVSGSLDETSGRIFNLALGDTPFIDDYYEAGMGRITLGDNVTDVLILIDTSGLNPTHMFVLSGDPLGAGAVPTAAEIDDFLTNGDLTLIPDGPFAPGAEWSAALPVSVAIDADPFAGTEGDDSILAWGDDDAIDGLGGSDTIDGEYGNDTITGGNGNDQLFGGAGNDDINSGSFSPDTGVGYDIVNPGPGLDVVRGTPGELNEDRIQGIDFGDRIIIEGVSPDAVTVTDGVVTVETTGDDTPEATFYYTLASDASGLLLETAVGGNTVLQLDPELAHNPGIGETIAGPQDFGDISSYLFAGDTITPVDLYYTGAIEGVALLPEGHTIFEVSDPDNPEAIVGLDRGVFLTSGDGPGTQNTSSSYTRVLFEPGDPRLTETAQDAYPGAGSTNDASLLTFTFNASDLGDQPSISFDVFFGSDEYPEYVNSSFVDIAAIYVNGVNYALFNNDPAQPLSITGTSITTVGNFYNNNGDDGTDGDPYTGTFDTEYDGFSRLLTVVAPVKPGLNTVTVAVADTGDSAYDSGIFVGNIQGSDVETGGSYVNETGSEGDDVIEGNAAPQLVALNGGADTVTGTAAELDGDVIEGFGDDDELFVEGASFGEDDVTVTMGSAILDIDTDGDGLADTTVTLQGDFSQATFDYQETGDGTSISATGVIEDAGDDPVNITGTAGADVITGFGGDDALFGLGGDDTIDGGAGNDNIGAGDGADSVTGGDGDDSIGGGTGNDTLYGEGGDDFMGGGMDDDYLSGGTGNDVVNGGAGDDVLYGDDGNDTMGASLGADTVYGGEGNDDIGGGAGTDYIEGGAGNDSVGGGEGDDTIYGGGGDDFLAGGGRHDVIRGGDGDDTINGGDGNDTMSGGAGADQFNFNFDAFTAPRVDVIEDFEIGVDSFLMIGVDNGGAGMAGYIAALDVSNITGGVQIAYDGHVINVLGDGLSVQTLEVDDFTFV
ncbi:Ca2+-binding RTX toxin-like protein [Rhodovulum bhavnagarense]|uniref:Ca2+-binding RTX toxin-like protein n=1 Tax=Rhodovulum bhavnagarense TaxID=992286 RepID=A0A4R2RDL6_9RHOB|nr:choice-of-anchor L domain-containing protein [Rhodovulum bhavnagarense]TCP61552.1 Ca2+-binding RTX toxin-like protein [Rhodovulum bhavnagarense]